MELNKIREMSEVELAAELDKMKKDLFNLRDIARVKTIMREKELAKAQTE